MEIKKYENKYRLLYIPLEKDLTEVGRGPLILTAGVKYSFSLDQIHTRYFLTLNMLFKPDIFVDKEVWT